MPHNPLSKELLKFFADHIHSIERLEILCLLVENPSTSWSAAEVFRRIQSAEKSVEECLEYFLKSEIAVKENGNRYRFSQGLSESTRAAAGLANTYRHRPVATIKALYASPRDILSKQARNVAENL